MMAAAVVLAVVALAFANGANDNFKVADRPVPPELTVNVHLWGECISGALAEDEFLSELERAGCVFEGHRAVYLGPYVSVTDEEGHLFPRGQAVEVCTDTVAKLGAEPYRASFAIVEPGEAATDVAGDSRCAAGTGCC